jgi:hypothetical protein
MPASPTDHDKDMLIKVFESTTKLGVKMDNLERLLNDNKRDITDVSDRLSKLESDKNKLIGMVLVISTAVPILLPFIDGILRSFYGK